MDKQELHILVDQLPDSQIIKAKSLLKTLLEETETASVLPKGTSGKKVIQWGGSIEDDELDLIEKAIEEGCENVDQGEW